MLCPPSQPNNQYQYFPPPHHNNVAPVILMVTQFALCHVGSHLLLYICVHLKGSSRRSSLKVATSQTTAILSMNTLAGEQHSGYAYNPDPHWRTKQSNRVSNFFVFFSFLSLQSVQCHTQHWPTKFILQNFLSTTQNLIWRQTLQLLVTRFISPTDRLSVSEPTTLLPSHKKNWQMALSISTWTL